MVNISYDAQKEAIILAFQGKMDTVHSTALSEIISSDPLIVNRNAPSKIIFDLKQVDYIASSFIRICVTYARIAGPGMFAIVNCQPLIKKIFKISGLDDLLNIQ
jgi:anti-anti-sigma factor